MSLTVITNQNIDSRHLPHRPMTLEQLMQIDIDQDLNGEFGRNRAIGTPTQITADRDVVAVWTWLEEFIYSDKTFRSYRKEVERFYNWCILIAQRPLSSLTIEDINRYESFLENPVPESFWIASKKAQARAERGSERWRPFHAPLTSKGIEYASKVLASMFAYLRDVGYIHGSPYSARRLKSRKHKSKMRPSYRDSTVLPAAIQYIPISVLKSMLTALEDHLSEITEESFSLRAKFERYLFVTRFLANTGLRRAEFTAAVMSDIFTVEFQGNKTWYINAIGKGEVERNIPLNEKVRDGLKRYLDFYGLEMKFMGNNTPILLPLNGTSGDIRHLSEDTVYAIVKGALMFASDKIPDISKEDQNLLRNAAPHKYRHTFVTIATEIMGLTIAQVSELLGHKSIETTKRYSHSNMTDLFQAMNKLGL